MFISVRHDKFYNFSSDLINVKNKEKTAFEAHFHKLYRPRPLTPSNLHPKFCAKWKASQSYLTLEDSSLILEKLA